jgi:carboxyl-terminal processing protease
VFDGGGINPDIITEERIVSRISTALERNFHLFDFATRYVRKNPPPVSPAEFKMPDPEFDLFINELSSKDVEFETIPTQSYNQLMAIAKEEGYSNELEQDMKKLEAVIEESKQSSVRTHRDEIRRRTESEIVSRYFFQTGRIQYNLRSDAEIDSAVAVLSNPLRYRNLLEKPAGPGNKK